MSRNLLLLSRCRQSTMGELHSSSGDHDASYTFPARGARREKRGNPLLPPAPAPCLPHPVLQYPLRIRIRNCTMFGDDIVVETRLIPPRLPRRWLSRPRLDQLLANAAEYPVTAVSAS